MTEAPPKETKPARILIVEDETIIAMAIEQTLRYLGFEVAGAARTGERAVELAGEVRPDLVLMDIRLAGKMDGIEAAGQIRAKYQTPVVYLTSHGDRAVLARAKVTEPSGYILKPFDERALQIAIEIGFYKHRAETRIRELQKMESFGQLAGGIAHNFNNLLTIVQGHMGLIRERSGSHPETLASIEQVQAATDRAANLTRQLLTFSQRHVMELRALDLNQVVEGTLAILGKSLPPGIGIESRAAGALRIEADESMLEQLIVNLVTNARDAMPNGGRLVIETREVLIGPQDLERHKQASVGRFARLAVSDTGCGIRPDTLSRIFEPFFTTKDIGSGDGLGLAAVHGIVKQHRGWIEVTSEVDSGARFEIFLPLCSRPLPIASEPAPRASPRGKETILLVEDEKALRILARMILERAGYRVVEAETGREAMQIWEQYSSEVRLVMTDLRMPGGCSGRQLADWLFDRNPRLQIILTSGFIPEADDRAFAERMDGAFLQKPYKSAHLLQMVRECLDRQPALI